MPRPSASCEVYIDDVLMPCTRDDLLAGEITILNDLTINWGRSSRWDQPEPGTAAFRLYDMRTSPTPIVDRIHAGSKVDIFATAPNPDPQPIIESQDFSTFNASNDWALDMIPAAIRRTNRATDPNCTTTTGKTAGGSAVLAASTAWGQFGGNSISITPNGSNNASSCFPHGGSGMTVFQAGLTYTVSCYVRLTAAQTGTLHADARKITIRGGAAGAVKFAESAQAPNAAGVTRLSVTFTVPANYTTCQIQVHNGSSVAAQVLWYDGLLVQQGSTLEPYFDGSTSASGYSYAWTGTANASSSTESYQATNPASAPIVYTSSLGSLAAFLNSSFTRAAFLFPMEGWKEPWLRRGLRPIHPGDTWTYSFQVLIKAGGAATVSTRGYLSPSVDQYQTSALHMSGAADNVNLEIVGTGAWQTFTGTLTNPTTNILWPVFRMLVEPSAVDLVISAPSVDSITYTAPAEDDLNVQVWAGRVTDVEILPSAKSSVMISVSAIGEGAQADNVSVGDEPWGTQGIETRIDSIIEAIPADLTGLSLSRDSFDVALNLRPRDVDIQPARTLIAQTAGYGLGVTWPMSAPGMRNHLWIEDQLEREFPSSGPSGEISACNIDKNRIQIGQSIDQVITVAEVTWLEQVTDPETSEVSYVETTQRTIDMDAVEVYGTQTMRLSTELASAANAASVGDSIIAIARASDWYLQGMEFNTRTLRFDDGDTVGLADAQALLMLLLNSTTRPACAITITDLTEWFPINMAEGFLEGGTIQYIGGWWRFDLTLTAGGSGS